MRGLLFLAAGSLGGLERINLGRLLLGCCFYMGCKIAAVRLPFDGGIGIAGAVLALRQIHNPLAAFTFTHDRLTRTAVVSTARFGHEGTFRSCLHRNTIHDKYLRISYSKRPIPLEKFVRIITRFFRVSSIFNSFFFVHLLNFLQLMR